MTAPYAVVWRTVSSRDDARKPTARRPPHGLPFRRGRSPDPRSARIDHLLVGGKHLKRRRCPTPSRVLRRRRKRGTAVNHVATRVLIRLPGDRRLLIHAGLAEVTHAVGKEL